MSDLTDTITSLRAALTAEVEQSVQTSAQAAKTTARLQELLALAARADVLAGQPVPIPQPVPAVANTVRVAGSSWLLAAVNPTAASNPAGAGFPGFRGPDQLVAYTTPGIRTGTNRYGAEASVAGWVVGTVTIGRDGGITVPAGGVVLSGHGRADAWLQQVCRPGATVEFVHVDAPEPKPVPAAGGRTLAVYMMDKVGTITQVPSNVTQVRVAFYQGSGLVEWGGDSPAKTAADLTVWRAARPGRQVLVSIGGSGGSVDMGRLVDGIRAIEQRFPIDGIDFDVEGGALDVSASVAAARALAAGRESSWVTSFVPPGGPPVAVYLDAAKQCQASGLRVQFGQQLYDAEVSQSAALGATQRAVAVLGAPSVLVGMMVASDAKHWTVDQCEANMRAITQRWPDIGGSYVWESSRAGTSDWAARVGAVLGL